MTNASHTIPQHVPSQGASSTPRSDASSQKESKLSFIEPARLLPIVTIDGPAGVGKSTLARSLAQSLKMPYMDTGAMFRTIALHMGDEAPSLPDETIHQRIMDFHFSLRGVGNESILSCNGIDIGLEIRTEEVATLAARIASLPAVRKGLKKIQQRLGASHQLVAEGRDMGTEIFPSAACKFFLDASAEVRAQRRYLQLKEQGKHPILTELIEQIRTRDNLDRNRAIAPLRPAPDACIINTDNLTCDEVLQKLHEYITSHCATSFS